MSTTVITTSGNCGFVGLLQLLFIALKLTGHIKWSWVAVLAPTWITLGVVLAVLLVYLLA